MVDEREAIDQYRQQAMADIYREHERLVAGPSRIVKVMRRAGPNAWEVLEVERVSVTTLGTVVYTK